MIRITIQVCSIRKVKLRTDISRRKLRRVRSLYERRGDKNLIPKCKVRCDYVGSKLRLYLLHKASMYHIAMQTIRILS